MNWRKICAAICFVWAACTAQAQDLPRDAGLPLTVQAAVALAALHDFDENAGSFEATIDLRLRWRDLRLMRTDGNMSAPPNTFRDASAQERMAQIWTPHVVLANQLGDATEGGLGLRIFSDGTVEVLRRLRANFSVNVDVDRFPFDRQKLTIEVVVNDRSTNEVILRTSQSDLDFSKVARGVSLSEWRPGVVDLISVPLAGWYNSSNARIVASVDLTREPGLPVASIFIPLIACLLIPLLALWLNRMEEGVFQIDTFELVNIAIGGFFAVIALNFTVLSNYPALANGDNAVMRLLALNYATLAGALVINILFKRFGVIAKLFGLYVQEQTYNLMLWMLPVSLTALVTAILWVAYV